MRWFVGEEERDKENLSSAAQIWIHFPKKKLFSVFGFLCVKQWGVTPLNLKELFKWNNVRHSEAKHLLGEAATWHGAPTRRLFFLTKFYFKHRERERKRDAWVGERKKRRWHVAKDHRSHSSWTATIKIVKKYFLHSAKHQQRKDSTQLRHQTPALTQCTHTDNIWADVKIGHFGRDAWQAISLCVNRLQ